MNAFTRRIAVWSVAMLCVPVVAGATTITANLTADDAFQLFISTSDSVAGTPVCTGNTWTTTFTCSAVLSPAVTNYIHVLAQDQFGPPSSFIGTFGLSDTLFQFGNGTQSLNTGVANWVVRTTGFNGADLTPVAIGANGVGPWGFRTGVDASAEWIWDVAGGCNQCTRYFSAAITPTQTTTPTVPEPATLTLMAIGLGAARRIQRRRA